MKLQLIKTCLVIIVLLGVSAACQKPVTTPCVCVPVLQCLPDGTINTEGIDILEPRAIQVQCQNKDHVCCLTKLIRTRVNKSEIPWPVLSTTIKSCGVKRLNPLVPRINRITGTHDVPAEDAFYGQFPWMVAVYNNTHDGVQHSYICAGSIISEKVVLTIAHCVDRYTHQQISVRAGEWDPSHEDEPLDPQNKQVIKITIHPEYKRKNLFHDIALMYMKSPFYFDAVVDSICLSDKIPALPINCDVGGWGSDKGNQDNYNTNLKAVSLPIVDHNVCQDKLRTTRLGQYFSLHEGFMCAGGVEDEDTCKGDGGGPLVCPGYKGDPNLYHQVGIVSWGIGCGQSIPGVYTSISYHYQWIMDNINSA